MLGGVVGEPPGGSYGKLVAAVARSPASARFAPPQPALHLVQLDRVVATCVRGALGVLPAGRWALFEPEPVPLNAFLRELESRSPRRRIPVPMSASVALAGARMVSSSPLSATPLGAIAEPLQTFLGRDRRWLDALPVLPGDRS